MSSEIYDVQSLQFTGLRETESQPSQRYYLGDLAVCTEKKRHGGAPYYQAHLNLFVEKGLAVLRWRSGVTPCGRPRSCFKDWNSLRTVREKRKVIDFQDLLPIDYKQRYIAEGTGEGVEGDFE
jgi:hypothetical protein